MEAVIKIKLISEGSTKVSFSGTSDTALKIELFQIPNPKINGELAFARMLLEEGIIDSIIDIGAANSIYEELHEVFRKMDLVCVDDNSLPSSKENVISIQGFVGPGSLDINTTFKVIGSQKIFFKIDTDQNQHEILEQIERKNWNRISVIQFECDYWHDINTMLRPIKQNMNEFSLYLILFDGLYKVSEEDLQNSLYKNVAVLRNQTINKTGRFFGSEKVPLLYEKLDRNFYLALRAMAATELRRGLTSTRRSNLPILLENFEPALEWEEGRTKKAILKLIILLHHYIYKLKIPVLKLFTLNKD